MCRQLLGVRRKSRIAAIPIACDDGGLKARGVEGCRVAGVFALQSDEHAGWGVRGVGRSDSAITPRRMNRREKIWPKRD
jgi:hypothetical protein